MFTGVGVTVPAAAQVGHLVKVTGTVEEFVPASDPGSASRTQLRLNSMTDLGTAAMPDAYVLTARGSFCTPARSISSNASKACASPRRR